MIKYSKLKINMQQYSLSLLSKYNLVYYSTTKKIQFSLLTKYSQVLKYSKLEILCKEIVYYLVY